MEYHAQVDLWSIWDDWWDLHYDIFITAKEVAIELKKVKIPFEYENKQLSYIIKDFEQITKDKYTMDKGEDAFNTLVLRLQKWGETIVDDKKLCKVIVMD